jgi:hypothetical protein
VKIAVRVQVGAVPAEEDGAEQFSEVFVLERDQLTEASVGLSLAEAHTLLGSIQESVVSAQATAAVLSRVAVRGAVDPTVERTLERSPFERCSGRCIWTARASWPVRVEPMPRGRLPSVRWPRCWPSAIPRSWSTCRPGSLR